MRKLLSLSTSVICFSLAASGAMRSLLTFERSDATLTQHSRYIIMRIVEVPGTFESGATWINLPLEYEYHSGRGSYHLTELASFNYRGIYSNSREFAGPSSVLVYHNKLFPSWRRSERPHIIRPEMANAMWGLAFVFMLIWLRRSSRVLIEPRADLCVSDAVRSEPRR